MIIICVCDFWQKCTYMKLEENNNIMELETKPWRTTKCTKSEMTTKGGNLRRLRLQVDGINAFYLIREIKEFTEFRQCLLENPALREMQLLWLQLEVPAKEIIDYKWNKILAKSLWGKIEVDYLMSWLSTLGGGYSALGEQFSNCAEIAGKISLRQLAIGMQLGDPFLQARCKLYYSISLIQTGRLRKAKQIVREQYQFAKKVTEFDGRLVKMCQGIWMRIQYEYGLRIKEKLRQKELQAAGDSGVSLLSSGEK